MTKQPPTAGLNFATFFWLEDIPNGKEPSLPIPTTITGNEPGLSTLHRGLEICLTKVVFRPFVHNVLVDLEFLIPVGANERRLNMASQVIIDYADIRPTLTSTWTEDRKHDPTILTFAISMSHWRWYEFINMDWRGKEYASILRRISERLDIPLSPDCKMEALR